MKKISCCIFILLLAIGIIVMFKIYNNKPVLYYSRNNIKYIEISEGSSSVSDTYCIYNETNNLKIKLVQFNCGEFKENQIAITEEDIDKILSILEKYKVDRWNNFNKTSGSEGANGFRLKVVTVHKNDIIAYGDGIFPSKYKEYNSEISNCLNSLFKK